MRFWTAFQYPLHQAALIDNGKIVATIPDHSPKTPARMVGPIAEWDDKHILIGRRSSVELWTKDGKNLVQQMTHPWIYGFHALQRYKDKILIGCAGPDCVVLLDWDGNVEWSWFAYKHGLSVDIKGYPVPFGDNPNWAAFQLTQNFVLPGSTHLNSVNLDVGDTLYVTLCNSRKAVLIRVGGETVLEVRNIKQKAPHDYKIDPRSGNVVVGVEGGLCVNNRLLFSRDRSFVKRIRSFGEDGYIFTYEQGVIAVSGSGRIMQDVTLPRPWNIVNLEM